MSNDFDAIRLKLEKQMEDLAMDIFAITSKQGLKLNVSIDGLIEEFRKVIDSAERCFFSDQVIMYPGARTNED